MFNEYAKIYDLLYSDKNYHSECDYLESVFLKFCSSKIINVLDLASGTGGHSIILSQRGYNITAWDLSEQMSDICREKAKINNLKLNIKGGVSMAKLPKIDKKFDAIVCNFSAVNYLSGLGELDDFLSGTNNLLKSKGILVFDFWNGYACINDYSPKKTKSVRNDNTKITRVSYTDIDKFSNIATVDYKCIISEKKQPQKEIHETHKLRWFFPREITESLHRNGYNLLSIHPYMNLEKDITERDWNLTVVAQL